MMLVHFLLTATQSFYTGLTADEPDYFSYAVRWAKGNSSRILPTDDSKSPIVAPALAAIPFRKWMDATSDPHGITLLTVGRIAMYVFQAIGAFFFLLWLRRLFPSLPIAIPLLLYLFDPLIFCYGMVAGSDLPAAALMLAACYTFHRFIHCRRSKYWVWTAVFVGCAVVAKASMIYLLALLPLMGWFNKRVAQASTHSPGWKDGIWRGIAFALVVLFIIHTAYLFNNAFFPVRMLPQSSHAFRQLATSLEVIAGWPVPLPFDFVSGFDLLSHNAEKGGGGDFDHSFAGVSIFQNYWQRGPLWYYYIIHFLVKTPLLLQLGIFLTAVLAVKKWKGKTLIFKYVWIWLPPAFYFCLLSFCNPFQIGIRHAMMVMPFLYLAAAAGWNNLRQKKPYFFASLLCFHFLSIVAHTTNLLAYTNEWLWPKRSAWKTLNDSSLAYGQSEKHLRRFLQKHPEYKVPGGYPEPGKYAVDAETLMSPFKGKHLRWLINGIEPAGHHATTVILFHVSAEEAERIKGTNGQR